MRNYYEVVLVGAGAAGLLCAGLLAEKGIRVLVLEKNSRVGKKLSATGNGRCNFTNLHMNRDCYYGDSEWVEKVLEQVTPQMVIHQFEKYGVWHREKDGYVYPHTNQAATVVNALYHVCESYGVEFVMDCRVSSVEKNENDEFILYTSKGELSCHSLVLAAGGKAGKESGGDGSGYVLAGNLGHTIQPIHPGLTGLVCSGGFWKNVAGTRIQGRFSLRIDGERIPGEVGEVQIVEKGVSGIPVFQMCRVATKALAEGKKVEGELDFVPTMKEEQVREWIASHGTDGLVPQKWLPIMEKTGNSVAAIKGFHFEVRDSFGIERAQVTAGGVALSEIDPATMASRLVERLFVVGELLDVDGKCGGYNLHMAWSTAMLAARELTGRMR